MARLRRATLEDVPRINQILNHPDVRPHIFVGDEALDFTANIGVTPAYVTDSGVLFAEPIAPGEYLVTSGFMPEGRGAHAALAHRDALDDFFFTTDAVKISAMFDASNAPAIRNLNMLGFHFYGDFADKGCASIDWIQWALKSKLAQQAGQKWAHGYGIPWASREELHMLGAFILTTRAGWAGKAMAQFNKWAKLSVNEPIHPLNEQGTLFSFDGVTFGVPPEDYEKAFSEFPEDIQNAIHGLCTLDPGFINNIPGNTFREKIVNIEAELAKLPQEEFELQHYFAPGVYVREILIPKGSLVIGKIHSHEHPVTLISGTAAYLTEFDGLKSMTGPQTMVSKPGTKRMLFTLTDCVWQTVHANPTNSQDIAELEDWIISRNYLVLESQTTKSLEA